MPRTRSLAWSELKIGLVTIFAVVMTAVLIFALGSAGGFFWQRYSVRSVFADVPGLGLGAPVRLAGVEIGSVTNLVFVGDEVEVVMEVNEAYRSRITSTSLASLGSVSLLGEAAVDIRPSSDGTPVVEGGYIPSGMAAGSLASVTSEATASLETLSDLLQGIQDGQGTLGRLLTDDALYRELQTFVTSAEEVTSQVGDGVGTLGRLITNPSAAMALEGSLENLQAVIGRIREGEGSLGRLVNDEAFGDSMTTTTENLAEITGRMSRGEGTAGRLMTETELYDRANGVMERLDGLTASLQEGDGTMGRLLQDQTLYENMNVAVSELRSLVQDIRADPRRYLNVRVSLF